MSSKESLAHIGHQPRPEGYLECIHCLGSGWILDPSEAEDDEDRTFACHMCRDDTLDAQHSSLERLVAEWRVPVFASAEEYDDFYRKEAGL
jgi:hypothetical protein